MYTVTSAQLPEPPAGADRVFVARNAVIVLDGASALGPSNPEPAAYVDHLGHHLRQTLAIEPRADLAGALGDAIEATASKLELTPGRAPSSTVAIARWCDERVDLLVLGDSQITMPFGVVRDDRLHDVGGLERSTYQTRLESGHGYDERHRALLAALQAKQAKYRNRHGGYWIAEADSTAAEHAIVQAHPASAAPWLVLATDGAYRPLERLGLAVLPDSTSAGLLELLTRCERWETEHDPHGQKLPRSKRHDDKTLVVVARTGS